MEPYVQVVVDHVRKAAVNGTVFIQPTPPVAFSAQQFGVVHDTRGRVILRASDWSVVGIATWQGDRAVERRGLNPTTPNTYQWEIVEAVLRPILQSARQQPMPPGVATDVAPWIDDAELFKVTSGGDASVNPKPEYATTGALGLANRLLSSKSILGKIAGGILVLLIMAVVVLKGCMEHKWATGSTENGQQCVTDRTCRSGLCEYLRCSAPHNRGDRCSRGRDCSSGTCTQPLIGGSKLCE